jgi:hypothetical protein
LTWLIRPRPTSGNIAPLRIGAVHSRYDWIVHRFNQNSDRAATTAAQLPVAADEAYNTLAAEQDFGQEHMDWMRGVSKAAPARVNGPG